MEKEDIIRFADEYGFLELLREKMSESSLLQPDSFGLRLVDGDIRFYCAARFCGVPISFRSVLYAEYDGSALNLRTEKLILGASAKLPEVFWPEFFRGSYSLPMADYGLAGIVTDIFTEGSTLVLKTDGLNRSLDEPLYTDGDFLRVFSTVAPADAADSAVIDRVCRLGGTEISEGELRRMLSESENTAADFAELLSCCTAESRSSLWGSRSAFAQRYIVRALQTAAEECREGLEETLSEELGRYERTLSSVRELYKAGLLQIEKGGFRNLSSDTALDLDALSSLPITGSDAGAVLLYTEQEEAAELRLNDMPLPQDVPHLPGTMSRKDEKVPCDVGIVLSGRSDVPLLLYYRADGCLVLRELEEAQFVALLMQNEVHRFCIDTLPAAGEEIPCPAGSTGSQAVLLPLEP